MLFPFATEGDACPGDGLETTAGGEVNSEEA